MNGGKRRSHFLRHNKTTRWPARFIFFDTETKEEKIDRKTIKLTLLFGIAQYVRVDDRRQKTYEEELLFTSGEELLFFIEKHAKKKTCLYVFAANIAFDLRACNLFKVMKQGGWEIEYPIMRQKVFYMKAKKEGRGTVKFMDVFNFGVESVEQAGKIVGLEKLKRVISNEITSEFIDYCRRDVEIIKRYMLMLRRQFRDEDLSSFAMTISSLSLKTFTHRFMTHKILIHDNEQALNLEREAYFGGRCECFRLGTFTDGIFYQLDVNSLYPYVMREYEYPSILVNYVEDISLEALKYAMQKYYVIAKVEIVSKEETFPVRIKNRLCYVRGNFVTCLHHAELMRALEHGCIKKVIACAFYRKAKLFESFVDYFYSKRIEAKASNNKELAHIYKIILNSLYGKFGQRGYERKIEKAGDSDCITVEEIYSLDDSKKYQLINFFGTLIYETQLKEAYNSAPAVAGAVTAYGREYLLRLMKKAGLEHVFYVDTDSLIVDEIGYENLKDEIDDVRLGKLKLEGVGKYLSIRGLKNYTLSDKVKIKGVKRNAVKISDDVFIEQMFWGMKKAIREGILDGVIVEERVKKLSNSYNKGIVLEDGRVLPFTLAPALLL